MQVTGGCHCGKISYKAEVNSENVIVCHCDDCQVLSGSAFRTVVLSEEDAFEFTAGEPKVYVKTGDSGNRREQSFCGDCGAPIYATSVGDGPKRYGIRLGTVEQRDALIPKKHIWYQSAQNWLDELPSLPKIDKQ